MRVLVVGATGFVGRALCRFLASSGEEVVAVARAPVSDIDAARVVVAEPSSLGPALAGENVDVVVNLAAAGVNPGSRDPGTLVAANSLLPGSFVVAARELGAKAFIQVGSSAEYAPVKSEEPITEESPLEGDRLYGASKAAGSLLALACGRQVGMPVAVLRLFSVFGAGEAPHRLFPSLIAPLLSGTAVALSPGTQVRDFMLVDDACAGIHEMVHALADRPALHGVYNLATGIGTTVAAFARELAAVVDADPTLLQFGALPFRPDDLPWVVGAADKLERAIGWRASRPLEVAIRDAVRGRSDISPTQKRRIA